MRATEIHSIWPLVKDEYIFIKQKKKWNANLIIYKNWHVLNLSHWNIILTISATRKGKKNIYWKRKLGKGWLRKGTDNFKFELPTKIKMKLYTLPMSDTFLQLSLTAWTILRLIIWGILYKFNSNLPQRIWAIFKKLNVAKCQCYQILCMGVHVWKGACRSSIIHGNTRHFPSFCIMPSMWLSKEVLSICSHISARLHRFCSNCDFDLQRFGRVLLQLSRRQQQYFLTISLHGSSYLALWGLSQKPINFASQSLLRYPAY